MLASEGVLVRYRVPGFSEHWVIVEEKVPESALHDACLELFKLMLDAFVARTGRDARACRNLAVRVDPNRPQIGFDPDLCLLEPAPPEGDDLESLQLWKHAPPTLVVEVVSKNHPSKDYAESPNKCAAAGAGELVIFDPLLVGPRGHGDPVRLQVWRRAADGGFERTSFGDGPAWSGVLGAWLMVTDQGRRLRVADDAEGTRPWPTRQEEIERRAQEAEHRKEAERQEKEAERREKEAALLRVTELEVELARRGSA